MSSTSKTNKKGCKSTVLNLSTLLNTAASEGRHEDVTRLIQEGATFQPIGPIGNNPLHLAARNGHLKVCQIFVDLNVLIDSTNMVGKTALCLAAANGHAEIVHLLVASEASVDIPDIFEMTPLHWACDRGHFEEVKMLLHLGADPDKLNKFRKSPSHIALEKNYSNIVDLIKEIRTKDLNRQPRKNSSELHGDEDNVNETHPKIVEECEVQQSKYVKHIQSEVNSEASGLRRDGDSVKHTHPITPDDYGLRQNYNIKETQSNASTAIDYKLQQNNYNFKDTNSNATKDDSCSSNIFSNMNISDDFDVHHLRSSKLNEESAPSVSNVEGFSSDETLEDLLNRSCDLNSDLDEEDVEDKLLKSLEELGSISSLNSVVIDDFETATAELLRAQAALSAVDDPLRELKTAVRLGQTIKLTEAGKIALSMIVPEPFIIPYEDKSKRKERENSASESVNDKGECSTVALRNNTISNLYNELMTEPYSFEARSSCRSPSSKRYKS